MDSIDVLHDPSSHAIAAIDQSIFNISAMSSYLNVIYYLFTHYYSFNVLLVCSVNAFINHFAVDYVPLLHW